MSRKMVLGVFSLVWISMLVKAELHAFTLEDGRALEAEIIDYNAKLGKVTLKRPDGKCIPVHENIFVVADRAYIREWDALKSFTSPRLFKITSDNKVLSEKKKEESQDLYDTGGNVESFLMKVTSFEEIAYELVLQNMNLLPIEGLRMEYIIYYEQSKESFDKPVVEQKRFAGKMPIPVLPGKKKTTVMTQPVEIYKDNINSVNWTDGRARIGGKGDVHGMRARIYMKTASGNESVREFSHPESLSVSKFAWED